MDIEGAEYQVLASVSDALLSRFRIIIIEVFITSTIYANQGFSLPCGPDLKRLLRSPTVFTSIQQLLRADRAVVWIFRGSWNSRFLRKDRVSLPRLLFHRFPIPWMVDNTSRPQPCFRMLWSDAITAFHPCRDRGDHWTPQAPIQTSPAQMLERALRYLRHRFRSLVGPPNPTCEDRLASGISFWRLPSLS